MNVLSLKLIVLLTLGNMNICSNVNKQFHNYLTHETTGVNGNRIIVKKNLPICKHRPLRNRDKEKVVYSAYGLNRHTKGK